MCWGARDKKTREKERYTHTPAAHSAHTTQHTQATTPHTRLTPCRSSPRTRGSHTQQHTRLTQLLRTYGALPALSREMEGNKNGTGSRRNERAEGEVAEWGL